METNPELTQIPELVKKNIETVITTIFPMFKSWVAMEDRKITQIRLLKMKTTMCNMKDTLKGINGKLDTRRKDSTIQHETQKK